MVRRRRRRKLGFDFNRRYFKPRGIPLSELDEVAITDEELETLRLRYIEKLTQKEAAKKMHISQSQYQRDLVNALESLTEALIKGKAIFIKKINNLSKIKNMKILVPMDAKKQSDEISDVFGRAHYFAIYDGNEVKFVDNPGGSETRGAGMSAGQFAVDNEITKVVVKSIGPNARNVLNKSDITIDIVEEADLTLKEFIENL